MSDKNLETVVEVEWSGGFTFIRLRDSIRAYAIENSIPLHVGSRINITKTGNVAIDSEKFIQIKEMDIYDEEGRHTNYKSKTPALIEYS